MCWDHNAFPCYRGLLLGLLLLLCVRYGFLAERKQKEVSSLIISGIGKLFTAENFMIFFKMLLKLLADIYLWSTGVCWSCFLYLQVHCIGIVCYIHGIIIWVVCPQLAIQCTSDNFPTFIQ